MGTFKVRCKMWKHEILADVELQSFFYALMSSNSYNMAPNHNLWMRAEQKACLCYKGVTSLERGGGGSCTA